jgi:crotonobetainyl-CoA:carnitine CoA-transferase CaiB-like acyl-CoA transferase
MCGQALGDLGAEVIKLEGLGGDIMRSVPPIKGDFSAQFLQFNRNKRSIALDLKSEQGREVAIELIRRADVLIENFRPGVTARLRLDYDHLKDVNPGLIYCSINGFGPDGPYARLPAYDQVIQGLVGFMPVQGAKETPEAIRSVVVDKATALSGSAAILAALLQRERRGDRRGQLLEVKMLDAFAAFIMPEFLAAYTFAGDPPSALPPAGIYRLLRTADGHLVGLIVQDAQFAGICRALGRMDLITDERFSSAAKRFAAMDVLLEILEAQTRDRRTADLLDVLWAESDVAIAPVNSIEDFLDNPQVRHNRTVFTLDDADAGPIRQLAPFTKFAESDTAQFTRAPKLGEHTDEILSEIGFDRTTVVSFRERRIIR